LAPDKVVVRLGHLISFDSCDGVDFGQNDPMGQRALLESEADVPFSQKKPAAQKLSNCLLGVVSSGVQKPAGDGCINCLVRSVLKPHKYP
jgi:hypothetical protein